MTVTLRPLQPEKDFPRLVEVVNALEPEPTTVETMLANERRRPPETRVHRTAAVNADDRLVGWATSIHWPWMPAERFFLRVTVDPAHRCQGIGARLFDTALAWARSEGAARLDSNCWEADKDAVRFAEQRGFRIDRHLFESTLNPHTFDEAPYAGVIEAAEAGGIRFATMADFAGDPEAGRKLWQLEQTVNRDIPGNETHGVDFPFAEYDRQVFQAPWYRPEGQIIALDGDRFVGMGAIGYHEANGNPWASHNITGVLREYRGRQIALALKLLTIRCARKWGVRRMRTNNDSQNAPMLAINRKLGFVPEPGRFILLNDQLS